jgi:hypothetical protein
LSVEFKLTTDGSGLLVAHHPDCQDIEKHVAQGHQVASVKSYSYNRPLPLNMKRCSCLNKILVDEGPAPPPSGSMIQSVLDRSGET